ncbi:uncharacterized protein LOC129880921 isoform X2 [Solanum dulcamara]|uniref:uncharacterized protein LOC129880921 isoform X2 n=1 Tax=Solanum dulcamara TaxID=45834 RepID=UPI0024867175|nr:uncharacterized protein LOC129880921 isoform X2 [Solanum dulcamara]
MCFSAALALPLLPNLETNSANCNSNCSGKDESPNKGRSVKLSLPAYKWRLVIAYDGWQYQQSTPTVQCILEEALTKKTKINRKELCLVGASRTDAGVHAWGQVAHFITPFNYETLDNVHRAVNGLLPSDIRVREFSPAGPEFHARFSVTSKIYCYQVYNSTIMDPFLRHYAYHSEYKLDAAVMREAAKHFVGKHNFSAFANTSRNDRVPNPVKTIFHFDVVEKGPLLRLEVEGSGFLYRQVRNMVALLLQVGRQAVPPDIVVTILESRDRKELAKYTLLLPPHGLSLETVKYNEEHLILPTDSPASSFGRHHSISKYIHEKNFAPAICISFFLMTPFCDC